MMKNKIPFSNPLPETNLAINSVIDAGKTVMKIYNQPFETKIKSDNSPITEADTASNKIIQKTISTSDYPILSEETKDNKKRLEKETVWIIDPLDGTSDFINKTGEFTIMIGLVRKQVPVLGIIYCPPQNTLYVAQQNQGSYQLAGEKWSKMSVSTISDLTKSRTVYSRHHSEESERLFFKYIKTKKLTKRGSSLKAIDVASGTSELYFTSTNKIKQWDTCASYRLVKEAGGNMTDVYGNDLNYNIDDVNHQNGIIVSNGLVHEKVINSYKRFLKS
jgi:3'(2'), 5'-bisphosphate nucleotidase